MKEENHLSARPNRLRENAETAISCRGPGPARKKRYTSSRGEKDAQVCPCGKAVDNKTHIVGGCEIYKEERDVLEEMRKVEKHVAWKRLIH